MVTEESRIIQIIVGVIAIFAAIVSAVLGIILVSQLNRLWEIVCVGLLFIFLFLFFTTIAYRLIRNVHRKDGGLLPRWGILFGSFMFSVYFIVLALSLDGVRQLLSILGVPLFALVGIRTFVERGRGRNET
ncbi:MAG: hypothetical protein AB1724_06165 [Thermodesulfobacteriota bacterium]